MNNLPYWQNSLKGVKKEAVSKADVRSGDGINSGSSNGGGGTDELGKMLLSRNFENGTLVIPDYITELGPGAISGGFEIQTVVINPDNFDNVEFGFYDYSTLYCDESLKRITQQGESPKQDNLVFTNITTVIDLSDGKDFEKVNLFVQLCMDYVKNVKYSNSTGNTLSPSICYIIDGQFLGTLLFREEISNNDAWDLLVQMGVSDNLIDFRTCIKVITDANDYTYISVNLDRDELPEDIIFINYDKTTNEWKNNLFYPDLQYIKGESFVFAYNVATAADKDGGFDSFAFLDLENLPSRFSSVDFFEIDSQQQLVSDCITLYTTEYGTHALQNIVYKTNIVKDGKNLFIFDNMSGCIPAFNTSTIENGQFLMTFFSYIYKDGCWYEMRDKQ